MATTRQQETSWVQQAPVQIHRTVTIPAPPAAIWAELANNQGWADWFPGCKTCEFVSHHGDAPGVGSLRYVHLDQFKVSERITAWEPAERWGMTVTEINLPVLTSMAEEVILRPAGAGTTIDFRIGVELASWARLFKRPLVTKQTKALELALDNLASRVLTS